MAEVVQRHLEEMLLEFEQSKQLGLFTSQEIKKIIRTTKRHEYKIIRRKKEKECYLDYIKYETNLLKLIQIRREKLKFGNTHKKNEIDFSIKRRIERLFRSVCHRFKDDVQLWLTFIEFLNRQHDYSTASSIYTASLQTHGNKYWLWILAAKFEFEVMVSPSSARALFQRALRLMPKCKKLWLEYFKLELLYVELIQKRRAVLDGTRDKTDEDNSDAILQGKIIDIVFNNAQDTIPDDPEFIHSFIDILYEFSQLDFVEKIVNRIYLVLTEKYSSNVLAQSLIAQRPLFKEMKMIEEAKNNDQDASFMIAVLEQHVHENYQSLLSQANDENLWYLYIDFCLQRLKQESELLKNERFTSCDLAFTHAEQHISLKQTHYLQWVTLLQENCSTDKAWLVIKRGTEKFPDDVSLWNKRLTISIKMLPQSTNEIKQEFLLVLKHSNNKNSSLIWDTILEYAQDTNNDEWTEELFQLGQSGMTDLSLSLHLKSKYLQWANKTKSIKHVRKLFDKLSAQQPASLQFYLDYIEIELAQKKSINNARIQDAFSQAIVYFGKTSAELWLRYIDYLKQHQSLDFVAISRVYTRALHTLESNELTFFTNSCAVKNLSSDSDNCRTIPS